MPSQTTLASQVYFVVSNKILHQSNTEENPFCLSLEGTLTSS